MIRFTICLLLLAGFSPVFAQNNVSTIPLVNSVSKEQVTLSKYTNKKAIVVIFTSNYCPYSKLYDTRIDKLATKYGSNFSIILVNPNHPNASQSDSIEEMAKKAKENSYVFPYLADKQQALANALGASKTPEVFVLNNNYEVIYSGAIDDNPQVPEDVNTPYLENVLNGMQTGNNKKVPTQRPTGCVIKKG